MTNIQQVESLLFVAGDEGISLQMICDATGFDRPATLLLLEKLSNSYRDNPDSAIELRDNDQIYRLVTKSELAEVVKRYFEAPLSTSLSNASLETLAIIAYKQPITRVEIDQVRGVNSTGSIQRLLVRDLIQEQGRKDEAGRPILYGTTNSFLNYFNLKTIQDLPQLKEVEALMNDSQITGDLFLQAFNDREKKLGLEPSQDLPEIDKSNLESLNEE